MIVPGVSGAGAAMVLPGAAAAGRDVEGLQRPGVKAAQGRPPGGAYGAEFEVRHDPLLSSVSCILKTQDLVVPGEINRDIRPGHDPSPGGVCFATPTARRLRLVVCGSSHP